MFDKFFSFLFTSEPEEKEPENSEQLIDFSEPEPESVAGQVEQIREVPKLLETKEEKEVIKQDQDAEQIPKDEADEMKDVMDYLDGFSDGEEEQGRLNLFLFSTF